MDGHKKSVGEALLPMQEGSARNADAPEDDSPPPAGASSPDDGAHSSGDSNLAAPTDEPARGTEAREEKPARRSANEAFAELTASVAALWQDVSDLKEANVSVLAEFEEEVERERREATHAVLLSLFHLYDALYGRVVAMEAGQAEPDGFLVNLLENLEGEMERHHVSVVRPQPGSLLDPGDRVCRELMNFASAVKCPWWRAPDTVARVHECGFVYDDGERREVLRKARVDVYRRL